MEDIKEFSIDDMNKCLNLNGDKIVFHKKLLRQKTFNIYLAKTDGQIYQEKLNYLANKKVQIGRYKFKVNMTFQYKDRMYSYFYITGRNAGPSETLDITLDMIEAENLHQTIPHGMWFENYIDECNKNGVTPCIKGAFEYAESHKIHHMPKAYKTENPETFFIYKGFNVSRANGNKKCDTFDFITVIFSVIIPEDLKGMYTESEVVKKFKKDLDESMIEHLSTSNKYTRYGVPVNYLKVDSVLLSNSGELIYKLSLKDI